MQHRTQRHYFEVFAPEAYSNGSLLQIPLRIFVRDDDYFKEQHMDEEIRKIEGEKKKPDKEEKSGQQEKKG